MIDLRMLASYLEEGRDSESVKLCIDCGAKTTFNKPYCTDRVVLMQRELAAKAAEWNSGDGPFQDDLWLCTEHPCGLRTLHDELACQAGLCKAAIAKSTRVEVAWVGSRRGHMRAIVRRE